MTLSSPTVALVAWVKVGQAPSRRANAIVEDLEIVRVPDHLKGTHRRLQRLPRTLRVLIVQDALLLIRKERQRAVSRAMHGGTALIPENRVYGYTGKCQVAS